VYSVIVTSTVVLHHGVKSLIILDLECTPFLSYPVLDKVD